MWRSIPMALCSVFLLTHADCMIMRNNALMSKMVSSFQDKGPAPSEEDQSGDHSNVIMTMKKVLCRNFPTIPCKRIKQDQSLENLIKLSVQQIKNKKLVSDHNQATSTHFPVINSEDLSNFLQVSDTGLFSQRTKKNTKKSKKPSEMKNFWSHERGNGAAIEAKLFAASGRKKVRKFYPHKINKDKKTDFSEENQSNSVEAVDRPNIMRKKRRRFNFRGYREVSDPPMWRIDYMKHGEPSFNLFGMSGGGHERVDTLKTKLIKQVPNVVMDDNLVEQGERRDVMHPDVYIKKNIVRRKSGRENLLDLS